MINPLKSIEINTYRLAHPSISAAHSGMSVAQISDVHLGRWVKPRHMQQVVDYVNAENPDLVALTGDYVGYNHRDLVPSIETLGNLVRPTFAVLGNHDHWTCKDTAIETFNKVDIPVLSNRSIIFEDSPTPIEIVGLDDHFTKNADVEEAFAQVRGDHFCLVLNHVPSLAPKIAERGADLILSGHTHGHQFNIPGITNRIATRLGVRYHVGAYYLDGTYLYINRGLGSASWPWRIGAAPELTFFELVEGDRPRMELLKTRQIAIKHRLP